MNLRINEIKDFSTGILNFISPSVEICKKHIGMTTFGYRRFLSDGRSFGFSDNEVWNAVCLEHFTGVKIQEYEKDLKRFLVEEQSHLMRRGVPVSSNLFLNALYETNVWNTLSIYRKNINDSSIEAFFLGATRDNVNIVKTYTEKLDFIHNWVSMLQSQLSECFTEKEHNYFSATIADPLCLKRLQDCLLETREIPINVLMTLSNREWEILFLLAKGYKRRDIALKLAIAPKTVDANIEHIKVKTNTLSKSQFMKCLQKDRTQEFLKFYATRHTS